MELENYNQDIISTSSSDIPSNYPNTNNLSFPQNKYPEAQLQTQKQYNPPPPPSQQQYYQSQNIGYSSHPQNQSMMPIIPENQYPPQNFAQPITPVFQPPLGVEQNISQVDHERITQPSKNMFKILRKKFILIEIIAFTFVGLFLDFFGFMYYSTKSDFVGIIVIIAGIIFFGLAISKLFTTNYKAEIILGDNTLTVIKKALCCRRNITNYHKNDLSRIEFTHKTIRRRKGRKTRIIYIYELYFIFKNGKKELILFDKDYFKLYLNEEKKFLVYYINNYINNQI